MSTKKRAAGFCFVILTALALLGTLVWIEVSDPAKTPKIRALFGDRLPRFCQQQTPQVQEPTAAVIKTKIKKLVGPELHVINIEVRVNSSNSTALPEGGNLLQLAGAKLHNFLIAEQLEVEDTYRIPLYMATRNVGVTGGGGSFVVTLPKEISFGPPAPVGPRTIHYQGRVLAERPADKAELWNTVLNLLTEVAAARAKETVSQRRQEVMCQAERTFAQALDQLYAGLAYEFRPSYCQQGGG